MALLMRPLRQWPRLQRHFPCASHDRLLSTLSLVLPPPARPTVYRPPFATAAFSCRGLHQRSRGLRLPNAPSPSDSEDAETIDSDPNARKSRNQKKHDARRAVRWGMELASFSTSQLKRILKAACLEREVFDAIMLVKRLGSDVREGKRRQFNYIGKLLREAQPELMDGLIQATKDGDQSMLLALSGSGTDITWDDNEEFEETDIEEEEEGSTEYIEMANRWLDGLINSDIQITNEVYSIHSVDFDRQELRKLVRKVHSARDHKAATGDDEKEKDVAFSSAEKSLTRFLRSLAKKIIT